MDKLTNITDTAEIDTIDRMARKAGTLRAAVDYTLSELDGLLPFLPDGYNRALVKDLREYLTRTVSGMDS